MRRLVLAAALFFVAFVVLADVVVPYVALPDAAPGQVVSIAGIKGLPPDVKDVKLQLTGPGGALPPVPATRVDAGAGVVEAKVPPGASGRYELDLIVNNVSWRVPGELRVASDASLKPKIEAVTPSTVYGNAGREKFDFTILGENFSPVAGGTEVTTLNGGMIAKSQEKCDKKIGKPCVEIDKDDPSHKLHVYNYPALPFEGPVQLRVRVGTLSSDPPQSFTLSRATLKEVRLWSGLVFLLIVALLYLVVHRGVGKHRVGRATYSVFSSFLLDKETNTYSLSKFQLFLWSAVAVYAYIYFFLCRSVIQWHLEFPDVPEGLPSLLGVSAGTAVVAVGLQSYRGSKGAGEIYPSWADFISSGGVVVAERFQFFVWTIVGCAGFLALLWMANPAQLSDLPKIPTNFFNLMGISAVGYLAGKAIRKPGPVIRSVTPAIKNGNLLTLKVEGENLQDNAKVRIDDKDVIAKKVDRVDQRSTADPSFSTSLTFEIPDSSGLLVGPHKLELANNDAQLAAFEFTPNPPGIDSGVSVPATEHDVSVDITGHDFVDGSTVEWTPPNAATAQQLAADRVKFSSDKKLSLTLTPGATRGMGKIAVITPAGARANGMIEVK